MVGKRISSCLDASCVIFADIKRPRRRGSPEKERKSVADPAGVDWVASHLPLWGRLSLKLRREQNYQ